MAVLSSGVARAETDRERAEREIQQQMKQLVKPAPPPSVRVIWEGVDSDKVALDDARFMLDDTRLSYGELENLATAAAQHRALYDGPVDPGKHQLEVKLAVHRTKVSLFEGLRRTTYKVSSALAVPGQPGLQVTLRIKLHYDENQPDPKKRLRLETREEPHMVVAVDDAPVPEPPRTVIATAHEVSASSDEPEPQPEPTPAKAPTRRRHEKKAHTGHRHGKVRMAFAEPAANAAPVAAVFAKPHGEVSAPAEPPDAGPVPIADAGPADSGALNGGEPDSGPADAGVTALAAAAVDAGGATSPPASPGQSALWIAIAGVALLGLAAFGLRRRGK